ncbi:PREDICTED: trypsin-like [Ceratosolen solmsi marchali]|uniref:chymotrypsin n=1 Tax=Ceratosolen solmsi marchali TaxID=326594 RepID=A0AAJ6YKI5_9HYME|nr:PREDICTED: trypsin-like [Ceratosolen solmsi marchali]
MIIKYLQLKVSQTNEDKESVNRIVGGRAAHAGEFPHQVSLQIRSRHICGGAIIGRKWILTAAHCAIDNNIVVKAGKYNIKESEVTEQTRRVENMFVHEFYSGPVKPYDIALLELASPLRFNEYVREIELPSEGSEPSESAVLSGWGSISRTKKRILPSYLQTARMPLIDLQQCRRMLTVVDPNSPFELSADNICTGPGRGLLSSCNGDSGGPLIANNQVIGITSWGTVPCSGCTPSVYTKVSSYINWIKDIINNN